jgi:hypothetical protein
VSGPDIWVHFSCAQPACDVPAVWRVDYADQFLTVCEMHYRILERTFPGTSARAHLLLPGDSMPEGYELITETVPRPGGFTRTRWVGGKRLPERGCLLTPLPPDGKP